MKNLEKGASTQAPVEQKPVLQNSSIARLLAAAPLLAVLNGCGDDEYRAPVTPPPPSDCVNCNNGGNSGTGGSVNVGGSSTGGSGGSVETGGSGGSSTGGTGGSVETGGTGGSSTGGTGGNVDNSTTTDVQVYSFDVPSPEWAAEWANLRSKRDQFMNCAPNCNVSNGFYPIGQNNYSESFPNQGGGYILYVVTKDKNKNVVQSTTCRNFDMNTNGQAWGTYKLKASNDTGDTFSYTGYQPVEFASADRCPGVFSLIATDSFTVSAK